MGFSRRGLFKRTAVVAAAVVIAPTIGGPARGLGNGTAVTAKARAQTVSREAALIDRPLPPTLTYFRPSAGGHRYMSSGWMEPTFDRVEVTGVGDTTRRFVYGTPGERAEAPRLPKRDPLTGRFTRA